MVEIIFEPAHHKHSGIKEVHQSHKNAFCTHHPHLQHIHHRREKKDKSHKFEDRSIYIYRTEKCTHIRATYSIMYKVRIDNFDKIAKAMQRNSYAGN